MQIILTKAEKRRIRRMIRLAKETILVMLTVTLILGTIILCTKAETQYRIDAVITHNVNGLYIAEDKAGYSWQFQDDQDIEVGTKVKLTMFTAHTDNNRTDDSVLEVKIK